MPSPARKKKNRIQFQLYYDTLHFNYLCFKSFFSMVFICFLCFGVLRDLIILEMALEIVGEHLVSVVVDGLVSKLGSRLRSELGLVWNFKNDLDDMKNTLISIQAFLNDAEKQSHERESVRTWLKNLKAAAYDIEDMLDQFQFQAQNQSKDTKVLKYFSCSMSFFSMSLPIMAHKLKCMKKRLDNIASKRSRYGLKEGSITNSQEVIEGRTTFSAVNKDEVLGRGEEATEIINRLLSPSDAVSIISIVGIGGLGKTTLAKLIFNDGRIKGVFEPKIWVHAMDFKLEKLVEDILLSSGTANRNSLGNLESKIKRAKEILDGKRYLIVLDDVWNEDQQKWKDFKQVLQDGKGDSKIIVTTRSERVSSIMSDEAPHKLKLLSDDVCSKLFEQRAFRSDGARDQNLVSIGEKLAKKCQGVPLAANVLGGMLCFKSGEDAWKEVLHSEFWELNKEEGGCMNEIISSLKLSYQYMPSSLKLCFVYCSMYPKAFELDKDMLIQQWIAQRFIQKEHVGDYYVNYLLAISFLEETERETYEMHDLVYDLATSIAGHEVSVLEAGKSQNINLEECRYASMINYDEPLVFRRDLPRKVRALHFQECRSLPNDIFSYTKYLRVLEFSINSKYQLPTSIYKLKQLRCLKILGNFEGVDTRIGKLWTLETLIIKESSYLESLPESLGNLVNLKTLNIGWCNNFGSLPESLGNLVNLKTLNIGWCNNFGSLPESLGNLVNLKTLNIEGCNLGSLPESLGNLVNLKTLNIKECHNLGSLPESLGNLVNLKTLNIGWCNNFGSLPESLGNLVNLKTLNIGWCNNFGSLPESLGNLVNLKTLNIEDCYDIESLPESVGNLMNLEILNISGGSNIRALPVSIGKLTNLLHLNLSFSRKLWGIPDSIGSLQKLHSLNLCGCINLKSLPESLGNLMELRILDIQRCGLIESPKAIRDMTHLKIQSSEPLEFGPATNIELYLIDGQPNAYVVCNIAHAERTNLNERGGSIKFLTYECENADGGVAEAMLEALQPHQNLQDLFIFRYSGTMFPTWMRNQIESFLPNLVKIALFCISDCELLPMLGQLPKLEMIGIKDMPKIRRISDEFCGAKNTAGTSFSSLKILMLYNMAELEEWVTAVVVGDGERGASMFPCLEQLRISNCPKLRVRPGIPPSVETLNLESSMLPLLMGLDVCDGMSLKHLSIRWLEDMISLPESIRHLFTSLETLKIDYCKSFTTLPEWLGELSSLRSLKIEGCGLIDRLPESIQHLTALETLNICPCSESLGKRTEKETGEDWDKISHIPNIRISTTLGYTLPP
ncbi:uncharacterized protein [Typha latifolia]|uniref:uncharacterized protein isoform X2 n=1 Tax=Typha latifolia TaxID=4733 RepID=UPI003C30018A